MGCAQLHVEFKHAHVKQYLKSTRAAHRDDDQRPARLPANQSLDTLPHLTAIGRQINTKLLNIGTASPTERYPPRHFSNVCNCQPYRRPASASRRCASVIRACRRVWRAVPLSHLLNGFVTVTSVRWWLLCLGANWPVHRPVHDLRPPPTAATRRPSSVPHGRCLHPYASACGRIPIHHALTAVCADHTARIRVSAAPFPSRAALRHSIRSPAAVEPHTNRADELDPPEATRPLKLASKNRFQRTLPRATRGVGPNHPRQTRHSVLLPEDGRPTAERPRPFTSRESLALATAQADYRRRTPRRYGWLATAQASLGRRRTTAGRSAGSIPSPDNDQWTQ